MGWKFDEDVKEWITTSEWENRQAHKVLLLLLLLLIAVVALLPILPARLLKWLFGYGFWPDWGLLQYATDLCMSAPCFIATIGLIVFLLWPRDSKPTSDTSRTFSCPICGGLLQHVSELAGQHVTCFHCGKMIVMPSNND
jgi:uncharacterized membrane protein